MPNTLEVCRVDLFTNRQELLEKYPPVIAERIIRIRTLYNEISANPTAQDRKLIKRHCKQYDIGKSAAYSDLSIVKQLMPALSQNSRDFHRWRYNEMILEVYNRARDNSDFVTMERASANYAKYNSLGEADDRIFPYDLVFVQPFTATEDPSVLGIRPIPNLQKKIDSLIAKYKKETIDIEDIDCEEVDLEEKDLFDDAEDSGEENLF